MKRALPSAALALKRETQAFLLKIGGRLRSAMLLLYLFTVAFLPFSIGIIDSSGYILYCPCMGRFGNQADHFLGSLAFAKALNRTLVLPPWVEYRYREPKSIQVPFNTYFDVEPLHAFHRVITMEEFMKDIAPTIWPEDKRTSFCYMARGNTSDCNAKDGNPFGPFWDTFNVDFVNSEFYGPLNYDVHHLDMAEKWTENYPSDTWPVLAFTGAPASFPIQEENQYLQQYLQWNTRVITAAENFIESMPKGPFVAIHLRNGQDWTRACEHVKHSTNLMASPQCLGYNNEWGTISMDMCFPSEKVIIKKLKNAIKLVKAKSVFVASDHDYMIEELSKALQRMEVTVHRLVEPDPHLDLAIMGRSNYFIGNCVSSFTAFVVRERNMNKFPSGFFGFPHRSKHDEL